MIAGTGEAGWGDDIQLKPSQSCIAHLKDKIKRTLVCGWRPQLKRNSEEKVKLTGGQGTSLTRGCRVSSSLVRSVGGY